MITCRKIDYCVKYIHAMHETQKNSLKSDEDLFLWHLISQGNKKSFENLFSKYYTMMYSYCKFYVSVEDAEEIVQDVMIWLWEKRVCSFLHR